MFVGGTMVMRIGGARRKSRNKLKKDIKDRGKFRIHNFLQEFKPGEHVALKAEPSFQKGMFRLRFYGKIGTIIRKAGKNYEVSIMDQNKSKIIRTHPVHLRRA